MSRQPYPHGWDVTWLAADKEGRIGVFVTAGSGPIPEIVLTSLEQERFEDIEARIVTLPTITSARLLVPVKRPDDYLGFAWRGLFAYDWSDVHRTQGYRHAYELLAAPERPLGVAELPPDIVELLAGVVLDTSFGHEPEVHRDLIPNAVTE